MGRWVGSKRKVEKNRRKVSVFRERARLGREAGQEAERR